MKLIPKYLTWLFVILVIACSSEKKKNKKIDRFALVNRHNVQIAGFDSLNSLTVGNGRFAFTVDATGLQTFPDFYKNGVCLGTQSEWGWHSFPNLENYRLEETFQYYEVEGRQVPYAVQWKEPGRKQEAANYFRMNPHRLHLGFIGLELFKNDKSPAARDNISKINQQLDLWKGNIKSIFQVEGDEITVQTLCHPDRDMIAVKVNSERLQKGLIAAKLTFSNPTGNFADSGAGFDKPDSHTSEIISYDPQSAVFMHQIDSAKYFVKLSWEGNAVIEKKERHCFLLIPSIENAQFSFSAEFKQVDHFEDAPEFSKAYQETEIFWKAFWESGGAVDFSETKDPRAFELERRVVLSQYLTRIQCAGNFPPQETGLTYNSWFGKPHLEMHWWHGVHWAYWNRTDILEKQMQYYFDIFNKAEEKAKRQGYPGVRWPKMTDRQGNDSPSGVGEFLIWQQPHTIYFAELLYRKHPDREILEKYATLVFATADFMAGFARFNTQTQHYILGPPLIPAQESLEKEKTFNPPFEIAYWHWALSVAQKWKERMGFPVNGTWQKVIDGLPQFAQKDGLYLAAESAPDSYKNERYYSDHPMVLGAFGMMPGVNEIDTAVMSATFDHIDKIWNWDKTWGWDYPMAAMCATRLGKPENAVELLMKDVVKNTYLKNGHNWQDNRLRIYLPGNGGLLAAVAMMCAGFDGNTKENPGFPKGWKVKWENLQPVF